MIGPLAHEVLSICATNCPAEGAETPTCLSIYMEEGWVEEGKPTKTRKPYFIYKPADWRDNESC